MWSKVLQLNEKENQWKLVTFSFEISWTKSTWSALHIPNSTSTKIWKESFADKILSQNDSRDRLAFIFFSSFQMQFGTFFLFVFHFSVYKFTFKWICFALKVNLLLFFKWLAIILQNKSKIRSSTFPLDWSRSFG